MGPMHAKTTFCRSVEARVPSRSARPSAALEDVRRMQSRARVSSMEMNSTRRAFEAWEVAYAGMVSTKQPCSRSLSGTTSRALSARKTSTRGWFDGRSAWMAALPRMAWASDSPTNSRGTISARTPWNARRDAVPRPIAAIRERLNTSAPRPWAAISMKTRATAFSLVKVMQSYWSSVRRASVTRAGSGGGPMAMSGNSTGSAPRQRTRCEVTPACPSGRVTRIRIPSSGCSSNPPPGLLCMFNGCPDEAASEIGLGSAPRSTVRTG